MDVLLLQASLDLAGMDWVLEDVPTLDAAVRRWPGAPFDVLLLKLQLPDRLGLEQLFRALTLTADHPVVVLSGLERPHLAAQLVQLGARGCVLKGLAAAEHLRRLLESAATSPASDSRP